MKIRLEAVMTVEQNDAAARVRREVFGTEWAIERNGISSIDMARADQLIARVLPEGEVVATVTILDTTGNAALHEKYGLPFSRFDRVARYTQMAVLKRYRGLNLPLYLLLDARRLYILPNAVTRTWLLFPQGRAAFSRLCARLGFSASSQVVDAEQGPSHVLLRDEKSHAADVADMRTRSFLDAGRPKQLEVITVSERSIETPEPRYFGGVSYRLYSRVVSEDEWIAQ